MKTKRLLLVTVLSLMSIIPLGSPAQATHNCGFDPCPHPEDVFYVLCMTSIDDKYAPELCA
ncbi:MAG TPA: hypothetical protein VNP73_07090 [Actinomycetota bacterium]|nr:hypothetical protein [Actinomycetota bacterium]